jgi:hypothetical protein
MPQQEIGPPLSEEDAFKWFVECLRKYWPGNGPAYGYDVYVPQIAWAYMARVEKYGQQGTPQAVRRQEELFPPMAAAAWELSRQGVLRPGVKTANSQATPEGSAGAGYTITSFGKKWLAEPHPIFVPTEPGRFADLLEPYKSRFGPGFHERAQQAIRCYNAHAYLACCAMCGAAAESILLATAVAKRTKPEVEILREYQTGKGRGRLENLVVGQASKQVQEEFRGYKNLLKYWRDESAHGKVSNISEAEAYTSLALLLRYAMFVDDRWQELTT